MNQKIGSLALWKLVGKSKPLWGLPALLESLLGPSWRLLGVSGICKMSPECVEFSFCGDLLVFPRLSIIQHLHEESRARVPRKGPRKAKREFFFYKIL